LFCWKNSTKIQTWMKDHNMTDELQLLAYFEKDLMDFVTGVLQRRLIVWQDLFDSDLSLPKETIVDVWKIDLNTRNKATEQSYQVIISACWYLDHLNEDWWSFYQCDPRDFNGTSVQKELVIGGHASMWGERVDETDFLPRVWPRASATAEKLWTGNVSSAVLTARERLGKFRCSMCQQGFPASPIDPGRCEYEGSPVYFAQLEELA
jgi:hexosaminidase